MAKEILNLDEETLLINVGKNGEKMELRFPSLSEFMKLQKDLAACSKENDGDIDGLYELNMQYLVDLGGDRKILGKVSMRQFYKIAEALSDKKK